MSSVSAASPNLSYLTQLLSSAGSPLASKGLSSQMQTALASAPASDIVQLSEQALQLQGIDALFGSQESSTTPGLFSSPAPSSSSQTLNQILSMLSGDTSSSTPLENPITSSLAYQVANYQNQLQGETLQMLTGATPATYLPGGQPAQVFDK